MEEQFHDLHWTDMLRILTAILLCWGCLNVLLWLAVASQRKSHTLVHGIGMLLIGAGYWPGGLSDNWTRQIVLATGWLAIVWSTLLFRRFLAHTPKGR